MTSFHLSPDELLEGIEGTSPRPRAPCDHCAAEVDRYRGILEQLKEVLIPPPMILATADGLLAMVVHSPPQTHSMARVTAGWVALLALATSIAYGVSYLEGYSSIVLGSLRQTPGGLGLVAACAVLLAVVASPALVILGHSQLGERSVQ
jgi:hypothetical protein